MITSYTLFYVPDHLTILLKSGLQMRYSCFCTLGQKSYCYSSVFRTYGDSVTKLSRPFCSV